MRILAATAQDSTTAAARAIAAIDPLIAAVSAIAPADASAIATKHALRYAVQCWDVPEEGKAIFWKPSLLLQGLYRSQFQERDPSMAPTGILRVTFSWNGQPLHVVCAQLSAVHEDTERQLLHISRELHDVAGPTLFSIDAGTTALPSWPALADVWSCARVREIAYESSAQLDSAVRSAFGLASADGAAASAQGPPSAVRLFCSVHFSVLRAVQRQTAPGGLCTSVSAALVPAESQSLFDADDAAGAYPR